jgi:hypothetical protein
MHKLVPEIRRRAGDREFLLSLLKGLNRRGLGGEFVVLLDNLHCFTDFQPLIARALSKYLIRCFRSSRPNLHCWRIFRELSRLKVADKDALACAALARQHWCRQLRENARAYLEVCGIPSSEAGTGYSIVFGGPEFRPSDFLANTNVTWHVIHKGGLLYENRVAEDSWIQHDDFHHGDYPLNMVYEALDRLRATHSEYLRASRFPGVTFRTLNFYDNRFADFTFDADAIALLHELHMAVSCTVL